MAAKTSIDFNTTYEYINEFGQISSAVDNLPKASSNATFNLLESLGLCFGFPGQLDREISGIGSFINSLFMGCSSYVTDVDNQNQAMYNNFILQHGGATSDGDFGLYREDTNNENNGGGGGGSSNYNGVTELDKGKEKLASIASNDSVEIDFSNLSEEEYDELISILKQLSTDSNVSLDDLFNEKYSDSVKEAILNSLNLSDEFKVAIEEGSSVALVKSLKSLLDEKINDFVTDEVMAPTLVDYLSSYAQENGLTYEQLITDEVNYDLLKKGLDDFSEVGEVVKVVNEETIQQKLLDIYESKNASSPVTAVKSFVDNLSDSSNVDYENLLKNESYKEKVYETTENLNDTSKVAEVLSSCSQNQIIDTLKSINAAKNK